MRWILIICLSCLWTVSAHAGSLQHQFERGIAAYKSGDYALAGQKLKFVLEEHPKNLTALYYYGMSKHQLGTHRSAQKTLEYAHKLAPKVPEIRVALARLYMDMELVDKANDHLDALVAQRAECSSPCEIAEPLEAAIEQAQDAIKKAAP